MKNQDKKTERQLPKTVEEAYKMVGEVRPELKEIPESRREYMLAQYDMVIVTEAINGSWKADWSAPTQKKWVPWFDTTSGFAFYDTYYYFSSAFAGRAARLCLK